jgi:hypothetical protein
VYALRVVTDLSECQLLWSQVTPQEFISDLWEVRACFQQHFQRPLRFLVAEEDGEVCGLLPLSWIEESRSYGYFPGETWDGKTWLEQNRIFARDRDVLDSLLHCCAGRYYLRYLLPPPGVPEEQRIVDEIGYLFHPKKYGCDIENYFQEFSHRNAKRFKRDIAAVESMGVKYVYDEFSHFDLMVALNMERFGERSYFADARFREGFRSLAQFLQERGWLRMTTVMIRGEPAAVDMGCIYNGTYTLFGGGTSSAYPGVAKLINLHHMRRACEWGVESVDFLCGDFAWKTLFHLTPRPLFLLSSPSLETHQPQVEQARSEACV